MGIYTGKVHPHHGGGVVWGGVAINIVEEWLYEPSKKDSQSSRGFGFHPQVGQNGPGPRYPPDSILVSLFILEIGFFFWECV